MPVSPRMLAVPVSLAAAAALTFGGVAYASGGDEDSLRTCSDFETQKDAQLALEADLLGLASLDVELGGADNGIACDKPAKKDDEDDHDKKSTFRDKDCDDFDDQEDAQKVLDEDEDDPHNLDADDDGVACEWLFDDDDASNDDDDKDDEKESDKKKDSDDSDDDQVKVKPKGGVDTGGFPVA